MVCYNCFLVLIITVYITKSKASWSSDLQLEQLPDYLKIKGTEQCIKSVHVGRQVTNIWMFLCLSINFIKSILLEKFWHDLSSREHFLTTVPYCDRRQSLGQEERVWKEHSAAAAFLRFRVLLLPKDFFLNNPRQNLNRTASCETTMNTCVWSVVHLSGSILVHWESNGGGGPQN